MLEHFSCGNAMALCTKSKDISKVLNQFSHEDFENVRHILSFRKLVENSSPKERIALLTDDTHLKKILQIELMKLHKYLYTFHFFLKCLHIMVADLPKYPLGKQVNNSIEIDYSVSYIAFILAARDLRVSRFEKYNAVTRIQGMFPVSKFSVKR